MERIPRSVGVRQFMGLNLGGSAPLVAATAPFAAAGWAELAATANRDNANSGQQVLCKSLRNQWLDSAFPEHRFPARPSRPRHLARPEETRCPAGRPDGPPFQPRPGRVLPKPFASTLSFPHRRRMLLDNEPIDAAATQSSSDDTPAANKPRMADDVHKYLLRSVRLCPTAVAELPRS